MSFDANVTFRIQNCSHCTDNCIYVALVVICFQAGPQVSLGHYKAVTGR